MTVVSLRCADNKIEKKHTHRRWGRGTKNSDETCISKHRT